MRWWGWGRDEARPHLPEGAVLRDFLEEELGLAPPPDTPPLSLPTLLVGFPPGRLSSAALGGLRVCLDDPRRIYLDNTTRLLHAFGKSYRDLIRVRNGRLDAVPDAVACPGSADEIARLLKAAEQHDVALVPFGGGTSVVGGVEPLCGRHAAVVALDLYRLDRVVSLDRESQTAVIEAGIFGPALEEALGEHGYTLGHFPQSFQFSTLGGWLATRSAGQNSTRYGKIEDMVVALEVATPRGVFNMRAVPARAAGPDLRALMVGSEGALGIITRALMKVHPRAERTEYRAVLFPDFERGASAARRMIQGGVPLSVLRLSDPHETRMLMRLSPKKAGSLKDSVGKWLLSRKGFVRERVCIMVLGIEGSRAEVAAGLQEARRHTDAEQGFQLGPGPGERWRQGRFDLPYLRDDLLNRGVLVDTLETSTLWSNLGRLYEEVRRTLVDSLGRPSLVACHLSHLYHDGASLYFTFLAPQQSGREMAQWEDVKRAATDAIFRGGGTLSHHHGVGADHRPWMEDEWGRTGLNMLRALKDELDPACILNPEKLI